MVQGLKFPSQNPNPRGEEGGRERTGRGYGRSRAPLFLRQGKEKLAAREEGGEGFFLTPTTLTQKTTLPLDSNKH
jgi:hypothetical protein